MKPQKFEYPKASIVNVTFFYRKEDKVIYRVGINTILMKATVIDGLSHVGMVPDNLVECTTESELVRKMKALGWTKC